MNHEHLKILHSVGSKIQFLIQNINDESEIKKLENISKLIEVLLLSSHPDPKRKPILVSYSPGYPIQCPKCNETRVLLFFDLRFEARYETKWNELIDEKKIFLENRWSKIKVENNWGNIDPKDAVPNWICKNCYDGGVILECKEDNQELIDKKIQNTFKKYEKTFTENSEPLYLDECGEKITLQKIYDIENVQGDSVVLIAVTRKQYNLNKFSTYREYIKNNLKKDSIYYGLWPDKKNNTEWDVLYTIENDSKEIQNHLNLHNQINYGIAQEMALIIDKNGNWKVQKNNKN